jgi:hypothetical protein
MEKDYGQRAEQRPATRLSPRSAAPTQITCTSASEDQINTGLGKLEACLPKKDYIVKPTESFAE